MVGQWVVCSWDWTGTRNCVCPTSCVLERGEKAEAPQDEVRGWQAEAPTKWLRTQEKHKQGTGDEAAEERETGGAACSRKHGCMERDPGNQAVISATKGKVSRKW